MEKAPKRHGKVSEMSVGVKMANTMFREEFNNLLKKEYETKLRAYDAASPKSYRDPQAIAEAVRREFQNVSVQITYKNDAGFFGCMMTFSLIEIPPIDVSCRGVESYAEMKKTLDDGNVYPTYRELEAFLRGLEYCSQKCAKTAQH